MSNFDNAILCWKENKCKGTAIIPAPFNDKELVLEVLLKTYTRSPTYSALIIVDSFYTRLYLIKYLTECNSMFDDIIKNTYIKIYTNDFVIKTQKNITDVKLLISYNIDSMSEELYNICNSIPYRLFVLRKRLSKDDDMSRIYNLAPLLNIFKQIEVDEMRCSTPVEEMQIGVPLLDNEDIKLLDYYNNYVSTSLNIFGSLDVMNKCNLGDCITNLSSTQMCYKIAVENGWNENLDMSIGFNIKIDELYNPASLKDRAKLTYDIIRKRQELLSCNKAKLSYINQIIKDNADKKILIINKKGSFANEVVDYINSEFGEVSAGYHDNLPVINMVDLNGNPVLYKTGNKAGQPRTMGAKAQKSNNERRFNNGDINILVTNNSPDKELSITVDVIIITSPLCENIKNYFYRLGNVRYNNKVLLYSLYISNTQEQRLLLNKELTNNHIIVNKCENSLISEENNGFMIVD